MQIELNFLGLEKMFAFSLVKKRMNAIKSQITPLEIWGEELCNYTEQKVLRVEIKRKMIWGLRTNLRDLIYRES